MPLTDVTIKNAKLKQKPYKLYDEKGMYILVRKSGKYFRLDYRFNGKRKTLALGVYPETTLTRARRLRDEARLNVMDGIDPSELKRAIKIEGRKKAQNTFEPIAREFITMMGENKWTDSHTKKVLNRLIKDVFPIIGHRPIAEITAPEILDLLERVQDRGAIDTAHRVKQSCSQIFRYAIVRRRLITSDPTRDLKGALIPTEKKHFATITDPREIGGLLRAIESYSGSQITRYALQLAPLLFVRPGELRSAEWSEINFELSEWRIPASKMKMRQEHIVPLSHQAVKLLKDLASYTGSGKYLFPSVRSNHRPMSDNTINGALRRLGYTKDEFTGHGFRAMASTSLHAQGWKSDFIERQLSHGERNQVKAAYNHAEYLPERKKMMQAWADYLDGLKRGGEIIPINSAIA